MLLGGEAGLRLEPVREVRHAALDRPLLDGRGHGVRQRRIDRPAHLQCVLELLEHVLGEPLALNGQGEHVRSEGVVARLGEIDGSEGAPVGAPL